MAVRHLLNGCGENHRRAIFEKILPSVTLVLAAGLVACTPASPTMPSYATEVRPIFLAHCVRCHGPWGDGGTLWAEPQIAPRVPKVCYLSSYDDEGDCTPNEGGVVSASCKRGAHTCAALLPAFLPTMPPAPSPSLNGWELDVVDRWITNPIP
jgi:hypothetical protein